MAKMKRINIDINDELMERAMRLSGAKTKKEMVNNALIFYRDLLRKQHQEKKEEQKNENKH